MNLKELASLRDKAGHLAQNRHAQANVHYQAGVQALAEARLYHLEKPYLLAEALKAFLLALQLNRTDPRPALAAAYLFILVGNGRMANRYLRLVLEQDPENADAKNLQQQLVLTTAIADPISPDTEPIHDYDLLYEELVQRCKQELHQIHTRFSFQPVLEPEALSQLKQQYQTGFQTTQDLKRQVHLLDQELDASDLLMDLQRLEQLCNRLLQTIQASQRVQVLGEQIQTLQPQILRLLLAMAGQPRLAEVKAAETELETILDHCDGLADQLDALEAEGIVVAGLFNLYQTLSQTIEDLQDKLDEVVPLAETDRLN